MLSTGGNKCSTGFDKQSEHIMCNRIKLLDASVQIASADDKWYARLFGKNLNDYEYYVGRVPFSSSFGVSLPANPKTWGLTIGYNH